MTVNEAVVQLRKHLQQTQQQFASELRMSISGLQNYERAQLPEPPQLSTFVDCAHNAGRPDLERVFWEALLSSRAIPQSWLFYGAPFPSSSGLLRHPDDWYEREAFWALRTCLSGDRDVKDLASHVIAALTPVVKRCAQRENDVERTQRFETESRRRGYLRAPGRKTPKSQEKR
jgi:transcriptional regulator with XRE-family HTH domain